MTQLLENAFAQAAKLPESEQDTFALWLLEELTSQERWDIAFANSADKLESLALEALTEHRRGKTRIQDPEAL